ncbi:hypothetical protein LK07_20855 [Streptomyces pluripotens]|uniref:Uncharacterized protein n=1 Tax=Streptomyces pluripotens TaxID=1355015 RepID=A0A221P1M2_9ACTN|nr:hypothetical protein [Streptomyces pluripotens]ARP71803.1 hypothetical protein LK06_019690 [Streptomyces pluripotens]ASN26054.1 hypothetical protein LK07_20855 [Streptomyces pluripotens]
MDLDALRHGSFAKLGEAVADWQQMTKRLGDLKKDAEENLKAKADKAKWAGANAIVTREFITRTAAEFADAHTQADSITKILSDTHGELISYRTQLNDVIAQAGKQGLLVLDTGDGSFAVMGKTRPDWASDPSGGTGLVDQTVLDGFRNEIQGVLTKATQSDSSAAKALRLLVDQAKYGFTDASYTDRDEAAKAVAAAGKLAWMAKHPADMSLDDVAAFNRTMDQYHDDPLFAEQFVTRLGAKGTLQFWTEMTHSHAGARGAELETMKDLQTSLGLTLATVSFSDSDAMRVWKKDLIAERNINFRATDSTSAFGALGSQVISSLLHQGQFDTEFLDDYREKLFKADKAAGDSGTHDLWAKGYDSLDLVFGGGNGRDPLEGLFDGLSHNPEAAQHAFESKSDLDHMLGTTRFTDREETLGRAMEAAVTGVADGDTTSMAPPHSATQVKIMANIMHAVADPDGGADLATSGLGESFGDMAAAYMPEISHALAGPGSEAVFVTNSESPSGLSLPDVTRFLSATSADPSGRAGVIYGESIYTGNLVEAHLSNPALFDGSHKQVLTDIGRNAGIIEGIVGHSAANAEVDGAINGERDYNDAMQQKGDYAKTWVAIGVSFVKVPERLGGDVMGAFVGGGVGAVAGGAVDRLVEGQQLDGAKDEALYRSSRDLFMMRDSVSQQTQWSVEDALVRNDVDLPEDAIKDTMRQAVNDGWKDSDYYLNRSKAQYE